MGQRTLSRQSGYAARITLKRRHHFARDLADNQRAAYDRYGPDGPRRGGGGGGGGPGGPDLDDLFEQMFGGGDGGFSFAEDEDDYGFNPFGGRGGASWSGDPTAGGSSRRRKPTKGKNADVRYEIGLEEAYKGKRVVLGLERDRVCGHCKG